MWLDQVKNKLASLWEKDKIVLNNAEKENEADPPYWQGGQMRILVVSDTHGRVGELQDLLERIQPDLMLHLGDSEISYADLKALADCPVIAVTGNCDSTDSFGAEGEWRHIMQLTETIRIYMAHGHMDRVKDGTEGIASMARFCNCNVVLFGHTHMPLLEYQEDMVLLNPGSLTVPRLGGNGNYAMIEIEPDGTPHYSRFTYERQA